MKTKNIKENLHVDSGWQFCSIDYLSSNILHSTEDETVAVSFPAPLPVGRGLLSLNFTGELNDKLKGFYRCKYTGEGGAKKFCAVTHFEVHSTIIITYCDIIISDTYWYVWM